MLAHFGYDGKEKVCHLELQKSFHTTYKQILTPTCFKAYGVWKSYLMEYLG